MSAVVLFSMAVAALAFGAGLFVQAGIGMISSLIAGVALFLVMAASHAAFSHAAFTRKSDDGDLQLRMMELESTIGRLVQERDLPDQSDGNGEQLKELSRRVEQMRLFINQSEQLGSAAEAAAQVNRLTAETDRLGARLEALRHQMKIEAKEQHEQLKSELQVLETLVKQVAERLIADPEPGTMVNEAAAPPAQREPEIEHQPETAAPEPKSAPEPKTAVEPEAVSEPEVTADATGSQAYAAPSQHEAVAEQIAALDPRQVEAAMMEEIRQSVEANKIELYLQPIMMLPRRRVRYYEALTRLKNDVGQVMLPQDYIHLAESSGMMPVIDNVMLFRAVQVLRRLEKRSSARGVFCNISVHSLLDPEFFREFSGFLDQNSELAESMFFEFSQSVIDNCGPVEMESLAALTGLGFRFSLDQVTNLDVDFQKLHGHGFRTVKIAAETFLHGMAEAGARIHSADMTSYLERFGMQLIVEKIEDEASLAAVLENNVRLGQGYLFSEPRPVRPEVFEGKVGAEAA